LSNVGRLNLNFLRKNGGIEKAQTDILLHLISGVGFSTSVTSCILVFCGRKRVLCNPSLFLPHYTASHSKRQLSSESPPWEHPVTSKQTLFGIPLGSPVKNLRFADVMFYVARSQLQYERCTEISKNVTCLW